MTETEIREATESLREKLQAQVVALKEKEERERQEREETERQHKDGELFVISISFILMIITTWMMVFGPRSVLFQ